MNVNVQWADFWVNLGLAIITLFAVLVALYKENWRKPKIKFGLKLDAPHVITYYTTTLVKLYRLRAINNGKTVARNCRVKLISVKLENENEDNKIKELDVLKWSSAPRDMNYSNDLPLRAGINVLWEPISRENKDISPKGGKEFFDLFETNDRGQEIIFASLGKRKFLMDYSKTYIITIEISGDNFEPKEAEIRLSHISGINLVDKNQNWLNLQWNY